MDLSYAHSLFSFHTSLNHVYIILQMSMNVKGNPVGMAESVRIWSPTTHANAPVNTWEGTASTVSSTFFDHVFDIIIPVCFQFE